MAKAEQSEIFSYKSCSYPNNKVKASPGNGKMLTVNSMGKYLTTASASKTSGVGRKTANVIASVVFKKPVMAVDTHVFRSLPELVLQKCKNPKGCREQATRNIP